MSQAGSEPFDAPCDAESGDLVVLVGDVLEVDWFHGEL